ncbi:Mitochondrial import inner membrane translocase subunit TIM12 [Candida viswanathii]|uniref:Mitochondrial import inner membrane translocase subunit n=1 Tax=Candida viswanathii TaxID=5486 RepID=A0A367Y1H3_9ASCO|nr:Mitochondrial import inner membrane translocase subunit TIM12 [Candida viswanathii]
MSVFLGSTSQFSHATVDPEKIKLAEIQFQAMSFTFNKLLARCEAKCLVHEYGEGELTKGELECIDRCVLKYVKANVVIGNFLQTNFRFSPYNSMPEYKKVQEMLINSEREQ